MVYIGSTTKFLYFIKAMEKTGLEVDQNIVFYLFKYVSCNYITAKRFKTRETIFY